MRDAESKGDDEGDDAEVDEKAPAGAEPEGSVEDSVSGRLGRCIVPELVRVGRGGGGIWV